MRTEGRAPMVISTVTPWLALRVYRETSVEMQMGGEVWCLHSRPGLQKLLSYHEPHLPPWCVPMFPRDRTGGPTSVSTRVPPVVFLPGAFFHLM